MELRNPTPQEIDASIATGYSLAKVSTNGIWNIGTYPVMFGVRVIAWREGSCSRCVDYCAGSSPFVIAELLLMVLAIFAKHLPEDATESDVMTLIPAWERRPVNLDIDCWKKLQQLSIETP